MSKNIKYILFFLNKIEYKLFIYKMSEHLYLLLNPKTTKEKNGVDVIKLGRTNCIKRRKGEHRITDDQNVLILFRIHENDIKEAEGELIKEFDKLFNKFEGNEYYTGDLVQMCMLFNNVLMKYMIKNKTIHKQEIIDLTGSDSDLDNKKQDIKIDDKKQDIKRIAFELLNKYGDKVVKFISDCKKTNIFDILSKKSILNVRKIYVLLKYSGSSKEKILYNLNEYIEILIIVNKNNKNLSKIIKDNLFIQIKSYMICVSNNMKIINKQITENNIDELIFIYKNNCINYINCNIMIDNIKTNIYNDDSYLTLKILNDWLCDCKSSKSLLEEKIINTDFTKF
jgi:ribosomal protein S17E